MEEGEGEGEREGEGEGEGEGEAEGGQRGERELVSCKVICEGSHL